MSVRAQKQQQTRAELIAAATDLFAQHGFHGTTLDMIAKAAGYTKGAVYSNFVTKDDLFLAALEVETANRVAIMQKIIGKADTDESWERGIVRWFEETLDVERGWFLAEVEFSVHIVRSPQGQQQLEAVYAPLLDAITKLTGRQMGAAAGAEISRLFMALSFGIGMEHARAPEQTPLGALEFALRRIAPKKPGA